jgi:beta-glucanase (GH16 family)
MKRFSFALTLLGACALAAGPLAAQDVLWSDEFDRGTMPDPAAWSYDLGDHGWGNRELQEYTSGRDNVRVENGNLVITARKIPWGDGGTLITSGRIRTENKVTFKYGTIEARIRVPDLADGLWPAFWTLGNDFGEVGWPRCGELDIMEMGSGGAIADGVVNRRVGSAAHWDNAGTKVDYGQSRDATVDLNDDFHVFRMDWTPTRVTTYIDGQQIWTMFIDLDVCAECSEFHKPHFLLLNLAVGGNYTGLLTADAITAPMPAEMHVDYVRILDNGHTVLGGTAVPDDFGGTSPAHSGSWYNAEQSGHGFSVEFGRTLDGTPTGVVYWYTYDVDGEPLFLLGAGEPQGNVLEVEFESPYGMAYGAFDPLTLTRGLGGTGRLEFQDTDNATFSYTPSEFTAAQWGHTAIEALPLTKLFGIPVRSAAVDQ